MPKKNIARDSQAPASPKSAGPGLANIALLALILVAIVVVAAQFYLTLTSEAYPPNTTYNGTQMKLSDTYFGPHSYVISDPELSNSSIAATNGFSVARSVLQNGTVSITLTSIYNMTAPKTFLLTPGEKLYYLELAYADDHPESTITDDKVVLTDSAGYVLKIDTP